MNVNVIKYMPQKSMTDLWLSGVFFKLYILQNSLSAVAPPQTPLESLRRSPRPCSRLGRGACRPPHTLHP